jgi:hypothetical protein
MNEISTAFMETARTNAKPSKETDMAQQWRFAPWLIRFFLLAPALLFMLISVRFIADPVRAAAASGIAPDSSLGVTNLRSGIGGLFLGSACVIGFCVPASSRRAGFSPDWALWRP